ELGDLRDCEPTNKLADLDRYVWLRLWRFLKKRTRHAIGCRQRRLRSGSDGAPWLTSIPRASHVLFISDTGRPAPSAGGAAREHSKSLRFRRRFACSAALLRQHSQFM